MKIISRREAFEAGLKRYFDGKKCPSGHLSEKLVVNYTCIACLHEKELASRKTKRAKAKEIRLLERENLRGDHPLPGNAKEAKVLGLKHFFTGVPCLRGHIAPRFVSGSCTACAKLSAKPRSERTRKLSTIAARKRYQRDPEKFRKQEREKRATDIQHHLRCAIRNRIKHAIKGHVKNSSALVYLGCSVADAKEHLEKQFQPGMTWGNHTKAGWHIDHIIPICTFDMTDEDQRKQAFHYTNLQPLWAEENQRKSRYPQKR